MSDTAPPPPADADTGPDASMAPDAADPEALETRIDDPDVRAVDTSDAGTGEARAQDAATVEEREAVGEREAVEEVGESDPNGRGGEAVEEPAPVEAPGAVEEVGESDPNGRGGDEPTSRSQVERLEEEGDIAADYLEALLDIADEDGDIDLDVEGDRASVSVVGDALDTLVGDDGVVLEALQELTRLAVYRETGERTRLMLDVGGFRAGRRRQLEELAGDAVDEVRSSGESIKLSPMSPFERKVVHDAVAAAGLLSESEGTEPARCVVVMPAK